MQILRHMYKNKALLSRCPQLKCNMVLSGKNMKAHVSSNVQSRYLGGNALNNIRGGGGSYHNMKEGAAWGRPRRWALHPLLPKFPRLTDQNHLLPLSGIWTCQNKIKYLKNNSFSQNGKFDFCVGKTILPATNCTCVRCYNRIQYKYWPTRTIKK
jgi:hypothetical protein